MFDCLRTKPDSGKSTAGTKYPIGSGGNQPPLERRASARGVQVAMLLLLALMATAIYGCTSGGYESDRATAQPNPSPERQSGRVEISPVVPPASPATEDETPEASLVRLSAMWDEAFARRDEALLRRVFHPAFTGIDAEIATMNSPENKGTPTPVSEISIESETTGRVVVTAVFGYDEGPVRQRILLLGEARDRRIAGVQDIEG